MSAELQKILQPGDQIIATEDAYFDYNEEVKKKHLYSQQVGDIIMVNNPRMGDSVGGTGLNGTAYNGRKCIGLGGSLKVGTFRMATPDDAGYLATKEQWHSIKDARISDLSNSLMTYRVMSAACLLMALWVIGASAIN